MFFYKLVRFIGIPIIKLLYPVKIVNKQNLIKNGKCVVVCNHLGMADIPFLASLYKDKTYFVSKKENFSNKFISWCFAKLGGISIDRDKPSFQSMRQIVNVLNEDKRLVIFPEGTRNKLDNKLQEIKQGTAFFAIKGKALITPVIIYDRFKAFRRNYVIVGEPIDFSKYYDVKFTEEISLECTDEIKNVMLSLQQQLFDYVNNLKNKGKKQ